jgi:hypothetical protein
MEFDKTQLAINRAARAKALLDDDLLKEAFATLETAFMEKWRNTPLSGTEGRERLWQAVHIVGLVRDHLVDVLGNGKIEQKELDKLAGQEKAKSRWSVFA